MFLNISRFLLISVAFLVPIFVDRGLLFPFTFSKTFLFSLLVLLSGICILLEIFKEKNHGTDIVSKFGAFIKSPVFLSISAYFLIVIISTIFPTDRYFAFWGNIERADGLLGATILYSFFIFSLISFERKHWLWFFKTSVIASVFLLLKGFSDLSNGVVRIESYMGNPAFFAGYLLFSISSALIVIKESKDRLWWYFSGAVAFLSVIGIFLTGTRGTLLGLFVGAVAIMLFLIFAKEELNWGRFNIKKIFIYILVAGVVFSGIFFVTRKADFWQSVPGLSRIAEINPEDDTTKSRLLVWEMSIDSINPKNENMKKFLIGWGPENSFYALDKYYNPIVHKYDSGYIDRSHNKFFDVLVMTGILGLIAWLSVWFFFFRNIFRDRNVISGIMLFFGVSFLVHLMFLFDQMPTSVALYSIFAFSTFYFLKEDESVSSRKNINIIKIFLIVIVIFNTFLFFRGTLISYIQSKKYLNLIKSQDIVLIKDNIENIFNPFSPAQLDIGEEFMNFLQKTYRNNKIMSSNKEDVESMFATAVSMAESYAEKRPQDYRYLSSLSNLYFQRGVTLGDMDSFIIAEKYLRDVMKYVPERPGLKRGLAVNLTTQGRYDEAFKILDDIIEKNDYIPETYYDYGYLHFLKKEFEPALLNFEKSFEMDPEVFKKEGLSLNTKVYGVLLEYFYQKKDKEKFILISKRLKDNDYHASESLDYLIGEIEKGIWPSIDFK